MWWLSVFFFSSYFVQTQLKCSHGETTLISVLAMVIRRVDSTLSLWMCLPEMEFTSSRCDSNTLLLCQLFRGFVQQWSFPSFKQTLLCHTFIWPTPQIHANLRKTKTKFASVFLRSHCTWVKPAKHLFIGGSVLCNTVFGVNPMWGDGQFTFWTMAHSDS